MQWLIILLLISLPFGHLTRIQISSVIAIYPQDLITALMALAAFFKLKIQKKLVKPRLTKPIFLFVFIALISLVIGATKVPLIEALTGSLYLIRWSAFTGVYFFVFNFAKSEGRLRIAKKNYSLKQGLLLSGMALVIFGWAQYLLLPDLTQLKWLGWDDHFYRLAGTLLDPGFTGILIILTLLLTLETKLGKKDKILLTILILGALLLTYSRASYIAFLISGLVYTTLKKYWKKGVIIAFLFLLSIPLLPRPGGEGVNLRRIYSIVKRFETINQGLAIVRDQPFFGTGFNLLRFTKKEYGFLKEDWQTNHAAAGVDNSFIFVAATSGLIGLTVYIYLLSEMSSIGVDFSKPKKKLNPLVISSLTAIAVHGLFNNSLFYPWVMIWIWYLLAVEEVAYSSK